MSELYHPTAGQREILLGRGDDFLVSGDGFFATLQGEGVTAGAPAVFMRLQNCNLHCGANQTGWLCDTWYTWDKSTREYWEEAREVSILDAAKTFEEQW